jgi:hypothetical protein
MIVISIIKINERDFSRIPSQIWFSYTAELHLVQFVMNAGLKFECREPAPRTCLSGGSFSLR